SSAPPAPPPPARCPAPSTSPPSPPATGVAPATWGTTGRLLHDRPHPGPRHRDARALCVQAEPDLGGVLRWPARLGPGLGGGVRQLGSGAAGVGGRPRLVRPAAQYRRPDAGV